ncbi:hypothetical protein HYH03_001505 [Edaphochlamys debaryana]|uniref:Hexosyltransferase n=1 Tax=Edaphochlamys debaryana TaxID=47281 RepID=A0A836C510_9CHLO|nr:hypothetical protein HYH03_001505 [Edaphochlamys debaryana]|eukprot:KAG2500741.1 hypothetical protein HYH03_001505 [Edaphochlamys debaryana]
MSKLTSKARLLSANSHMRPQAEWTLDSVEGGKASWVPPKPEDVRVFIGVMTAATSPGTEPGSKYDYTARRNKARQLWMHLARRYGHVALAFVVGRSADPGREAALAAEQRRHGDFMVLPVEDRYDNLSNKTRVYLREVLRQYPNVDYVVKMDDDVLILPERLLMAADSWTAMGADYVGCANKVQPDADPASRYYNPHHRLVKTYPLYFHGSNYMLSGRIVRDVILPNFDNLRTARSTEDTALSWWMLASDAVFFEDRRLCRLTCDAATVALADQEHAGFPMEYWDEVMSNPGCTAPAEFPLPYVPVQYRKYPGLERMHSMMV